MQAFHNDPAIKAKYLARLAEHHQLDQIIQGTGFDHEGNHGCAVGCTLDNYDHKAYETELGLPMWLAYLEDKIFEGLQSAKAPQFAVNFLAVIPVGANVEKVRWQLAVARHTRNLKRLAINTEPYAERCRSAIYDVIAYCKSQLEGTIAEAAVRSAAAAVRSAAAEAAEV